jgi:CheY-like chemotaxis protein
VSHDDQHRHELDNHPFELRATVEHAIAQFAGAAGELDLISHLAEDCPAMVIGDVARLRQVLGTLVGNAVRFTEHGDVLLRVEVDVAVPAAQHPSQVGLRFTVADTGIGISPANLDRLFQDGTCPGLAISQKIVEAMGGRLTATSTLGNGSEFTFGVVLGRFDDPRTIPRPRLGSTELTRLAGRNVLVVIEDDAERQALRRELEGYGMACTTAASPLDAVALVGAGRSFDIAVLDAAAPMDEIQMMDGVQLARVLRRLPAGRRLPLVLLSSLEDFGTLGPTDHDDDVLFAAVLTGPRRSVPLFAAITRALASDATTEPPQSSRPCQPCQPAAMSTDGLSEI